MDPKEQEFRTSDTGIIRHSYEFAEEFKSIDSISDFIIASAELCENNPDAKAILLQLQRMARLIATPHTLEGGPSQEEDIQRANQFYWGSILGLRFSEDMLGKGWEDKIYLDINDLYRVRHDAVLRTYIPDITSHRLSPADEILEIRRDLANSIVSRLVVNDDGIEPLPEPYDEIVAKLALLSSDNVILQESFSEGITLVISLSIQRHMRDHIQEIIALRKKEKEVIDEMISGIAENYDQ